MLLSIAWVIWNILRQLGQKLERQTKIHTPDCVGKFYVSTVKLNIMLFHSLFYQALSWSNTGLTYFQYWFDLLSTVGWFTFNNQKGSALVNDKTIIHNKCWIVKIQIVNKELNLCRSYHKQMFSYLHVCCMYKCVYMYMRAQLQQALE